MNERTKKGFLYGAIGSSAVSVGAVTLTYLADHDKISREIVLHPEIVPATSGIVVLYVLGWSAGGAVLNGYIFPMIDKVFTKVGSVVKNKFHDESFKGL